MQSVIRIGEVSKVNYDKGTIEVAYKDRDDSVTDEICMVSNNLYRMPVVGQMACVLHNSADQEMGTCIGTFWNDDNKPPGGKEGLYRYAGTVKAVREQVSVTYPDSEVEEWFDYGGTPGFWRLNVNITDAPAQYHTIDEMEDLLGYTKRLTAHLEHISYMVRHGISIGAQVECMAYKVPICGATICGTYWRPSTLGWSSNGLLNVGGQAEAFLDSPKITGTIPRISTKGWSGGQTLDATPQMDAYKIHPAESGDGTATGEKPQAATLGASSAATVSNAVKVEAFKVKPRVCGRAKCNK